MWIVNPCCMKFVYGAIFGEYKNEYYWVQIRRKIMDVVYEAEILGSMDINIRVLILNVSHVLLWLLSGYEHDIMALDRFWKMEIRNIVRSIMLL